MSSSQNLPQNLVYSTVLEALNNTRQLPEQTIPQITDALKKMLLAYLKLDSAKTTTYFECKGSRLNSNKIKSLQSVAIPDYIKAAYSQLNNLDDMYTVSVDEEKELTRHIDRKIVTYLLIRNKITKVNDIYPLHFKMRIRVNAKSENYPSLSHVKYTSFYQCL